MSPDAGEAPAGVLPGLARAVGVEPGLAEVQELFKEVDSVVLATARADGQPNGCIVAMKVVIDDETVYLSDQFFK